MIYKPRDLEQVQGLQAFDRQYNIIRTSLLELPRWYWNTPLVHQGPLLEEVDHYHDQDIRANLYVNHRRYHHICQ